jgi:tripartite-type tricarboxylate transporter receptor subunit TctC
VPVVVENVGGATGTIAAARVLAAPPDGQIIFQGTQNELILPPLTNSVVRYQPDAFVNVQPITVTPLVLLVRGDLPVNDVQSFLREAAARDEKTSYTYGTVGVGSLYHLITDYLGKRQGVPFTHVPYTGTAPVIQALAGGQIDFSIMPFQASMLELIKSGRFKALAVLSREKPEVLAHLPSMSDSPGLSDFDYASNAGYFVRKGTSEDIRRKLNAAIGAALQRPEVISKLQADGRKVAPAMTMEEAEKAYADEVAKYRELIRVTGYKHEG